ncbi:hypothetical protein Cgig2_033807 [Carnegiea gigantea]|uniref:PA domain-containing protein n=1 Tax=Carnegiea gigantea TaxID=171969 RepID=A0A9Q1K8N9_9CARY|nr:hypothetical protein Cgig2_033807 [Carnegiea gigantea]
MLLLLHGENRVFLVLVEFLGKIELRYSIVTSTVVPACDPGANNSVGMEKQLEKHGRIALQHRSEDGLGDLLSLARSDCLKESQRGEVKVKYWIDDVEKGSFSAVTAEFGLYPPVEKKSLRLAALFTNPLNCCSYLSSELNQSVAVSIRGECDFTTKAKIAQSDGAAALVVINNIEELDYMGCSKNDTNLNITIPVVMIQRSGGDILTKSVGAGKRGKLLKLGIFFMRQAREK